jgi:phenylalanyl-tRNA synthetase beta chain
MKLIYSHLQKFLPDLNVEPQKLRDDLTMVGHFTNYYEEIEGEIVFDLDIKINRGDCLGYYGLAKDLSILYNLPLQSLSNEGWPKSNYSLPIKVETDNVTRVMAVKIVHLKNSTSPEWLQKFVRIHGTNSINTLVDLTNYVMFMYGIPNHAFDTAKSTDNLIWQMNPGYTEFKSLDGTVLPINKDILMVNNKNRALSLSFWGGESCSIDNSTTDTIIELAIYNPTTVRHNSHQLKVTTEAATRLEKFLDPESIPTAIGYLAQLIVEHCGGSIGSEVFDYYPNPEIATPIEFDPKLPSIVSGIDIPEDVALDIVARVGTRKDIVAPEDLVEEVIRFYGYQNIPKNEPLTYKEVKNITPKIIYLIEQLKDKLVSEGYDEVITWPLVSEAVDPKTVIKTENSINAEVIYLRQSLIPSLKLQLDQYNRYKLPNPKFFEIGKVFSKDGDKYIEKYALGTYDGLEFKETILDDLEKPESYIPQIIDNQAVELTSQIITLDANVTIDGSPEPLDLIKKYSALIDKNILWSIEITDIFESKYTFRVCYYNTDDKTAKKIHLKTFNLN